MTLLVSSHILAELDEYSSHMLALRDGRILENRALNTLHTVSVQRRLHLELATTDVQLADWLSQQANISNISANAHRTEFDFSGDLSAQAALLKSLVEAGFAVSSLAEHKENLQQSYLRSVAAHLEDAA